MDATSQFFTALAPTYGEAWTIEEETRVVAAGMAAAERTVADPAAAMAANHVLHDAAPTARARKTFLEVGCGNGRLLVQLPRGAIGLDFSIGMLLEARRRAPGARLVCGEAQRLPFRRGVFTAIVAINMVHNHKDPTDVLEECARAASTLIIDLRNRRNPVVAVKAWRGRHAKFIHYTAQLPQTWARILKAAGWTRRKMQSIVRPLADPREGFRLRHLIGWMISRLPGLAPAEVWLCEKREPAEQ